ncbi:MAG: ABC transporter ATP-binding protein [Verrucomicrobiia bacterium]
MIEFFRRLLNLAKPYWLRLVLGIVFGFLGGLIDPLLVLLVPLVGSVVFAGADNNSATAFLKNLSPKLQTIADTVAHWFSASGASPGAGLKILAILLVPLVFVLRGVFSYLNVYCLQWAAIRAITDLRIRLFAHLQNLSVGFFARSNTGDLMSRINSDTMALQNTITGTLAVIVKDPATVMIMVGVMFFGVDAKLTLITMLAFPVCLIPVIVYSRKVRKSAAVVQDSYSELSTVMHESFTGNRIIKAYNLEARAVQQFKEVSQRFVSHRMRIIRSEEIPGPLNEFLAAIGVALLFGYFAFQPNPDVTKVIQFGMAIFVVYRPIKNITRLHNQLEQARAASQQVFDLLEMQNSVREPAQPKILKADGADIQFDHVHFSYGEKIALDDIQLQIKPGQLVALVGASGSGKTTLANLLLRFYDPQRGAIRIGGVDIRDVTTRDLRNQIAVVTQETILFNDTVRNNIELGRPGASKEEIIAAARHAYAYDFIMEKPNGFDTFIGEKGVTLSGGQRQRLAIARAVLKNAPILVLDEATSSLDTESERAVQAALDELMKGRTTICIAHRLSTILHADEIVVLDQGRIVETGTHMELVRRGGVYQKLYELQFTS